MNGTARQIARCSYRPNPSAVVTEIQGRGDGAQSWAIA